MATGAWCICTRRNVRGTSSRRASAGNAPKGRPGKGGLLAAGTGYTAQPMRPSCGPRIMARAGNRPTAQTAMTASAQRGRGREGCSFRPSPRLAKASTKRRQFCSSRSCRCAPVVGGHPAKGPLWRGSGACARRNITLAGILAKAQVRATALHLFVSAGATAGLVSGAGAGFGGATLPAHRGGSASAGGSVVGALPRTCAPHRERLLLRLARRAWPPPPPDGETWRSAGSRATRPSGRCSPGRPGRSPAACP
jgi:hypothetical protein